IAPIALAPLATPWTFDTGIPDVGDAWFAVGRKLYTGTAGVPVERATLESGILAIDRLGDRLAVALRDVGVLVLDPNDSFRVLSRQPRSANTPRLVVSGAAALTEENGTLQGFTISGNAVEPYRTVTPLGAIRDVQASADGFRVLSDAG